MNVIRVPNVHTALREGIHHILHVDGVERPSRNGPVLQSVLPVTTVYEKPCERVMFWSERDANPFLHLYESLWMLSGTNSLAPLLRYTKQMAEYSDNGEDLHGAYGHRWRTHFGKDQLSIVARRLSDNPDDRRSVVQMWDQSVDLGWTGKDVPCNMIISFQINPFNELDMTVFCRSNDIIWGAYGANAVHFSILQEYMAAWIGVDVGKYYQVSVNYHAYLKTLTPLVGLLDKPFYDLYQDEEVVPVRLVSRSLTYTSHERVMLFDKRLKELLMHADTGFELHRSFDWGEDDAFFNMAYAVLHAHEIWRTRAAPQRYESAMARLNSANPKVDWVVAAKEWIQRRFSKWVNGNQDQG